MESSSHPFPKAVCLVLLVALLLPETTLSQVKARGISNRGSMLEFLELRVVETDATLKFAKSTVPFDRPFFLKIRRIKQGTSGVVAGWSTDKVDTMHIIKDTVDLKITRTNSFLSEKKVVDNSQKQPAATIESVYLIRTTERAILPKNQMLGNDYKIEINKNIYSSGNQKGKVYQESTNSEFVFVEIPNLKPNSSYQLEIDWRTSGRLEKEIYYFTTVPAKLESRAKERLTPQFGVANVIFNGDNSFYKVSLVFGVYYQIRPVDPDIPVRNYAVFSTQRLSLLLGVTLNSLSSETRGNLLGNSNLMLGAGYHAFDGVRFSVGQVIFTDISEENGSHDQNKDLSSTLYVSATIDLELQDLFGGIISALGLQ